MNSAQYPTYDAALAAKFAGAARHSRLVRILRIAVPATVVLALAAIVAVSTFLNPFQIPVKLDSGNLVVTGTKITMESPHMSGFTPDQRPYELWAKTATQDITDPDHVDLHDLRAKVLMEDQSTLFLDARTGRFDNKQQQLDLHKDIFLRTSTGYEARLNSAFVDMGKGTVSSDEHVDVKLTNGTLTADRLRITEGGDVIRFEGNVVMHLDKLDDPAAQPAPPEPAPPVKTRTPQNKSANSK
ncbi:LPS export ABC transporter periplasmic protein LptC [Bradyrhizobium sp. SSUT18]|uniref:LPS export ABC transporter periplasmic protein LptC n=1 Tax=unclassified Bradyrhizobium TaxID=2631580 RepID=UPI0024495791|nr:MULTISPECIES: LPS export ABC transporter periplasmic protein LptC [unclassified Bradyrhizobium]MDH2342508.1 LPS export ABC transporter periplasmic protein LptC [Bradyrhizobium sp. SSUT77]MDH2350037.1 LPS export ABC transporter periplasmic protein LptC [Bradyrhizobium sp. SSUT112]MDH2406178.1 LPS export ABC transporter periplasmic protein LptC [Bradyrhizobium sp. SSUT18]